MHLNAMQALNVSLRIAVVSKGAELVGASRSAWQRFTVVFCAGLATLCCLGFNCAVKAASIASGSSPVAALPSNSSPQGANGAMTNSFRESRVAVAGPAKNARKEFEILTARNGTIYHQAMIQRVEPDGVTIAFKPLAGGMGMAKLKFKDLPDEIQQQYDYDPQKAIQYESNRVASLAKAAADAAEAERQEMARAERDASNTLAVLTRIVSEYHKGHTYIGSSNKLIFACVDMSCDVWNMVVTRGIKAKMFVGNIDMDIKSLDEANHAWVLAEFAPQKWIALECTGGVLVSEKENARYYAGASFPTPRELRDASVLIQQYNETVDKRNKAASAFKEMLNRYKDARSSARDEIMVALVELEIAVKERDADLAEFKRRLNALTVVHE